MQSDSTPVQIPLLARDGSVVGYTLVDAADADWVNQWVWRILRGHRTSYARRCAVIDGTFTTMLLHRELLGLPRTGREPQVDHIDHDGLNNTRDNLRIAATHAEQQQHHQLRRDSTSGYRGVSWDKVNEKWTAQGMLHGQYYHLGRFATIEEAAQIALEWRKKHLPFAIE